MSNIIAQPMPRLTYILRQSKWAVRPVDDGFWWNNIIQIITIDINTASAANIMINKSRIILTIWVDIEKGFFFFSYCVSHFNFKRSSRISVLTGADEQSK